MIGTLPLAGMNSEVDEKGVAGEPWRFSSTCCFNYLFHEAFGTKIYVRSSHLTITWYEMEAVT